MLKLENIRIAKNATRYEVSRSLVQALIGGSGRDADTLMGGLLEAGAPLDKNADAIAEELQDCSDTNPHCPKESPQEPLTVSWGRTLEVLPDESQAAIVYTGQSLSREEVAHLLRTMKPHSVIRFCPRPDVPARPVRPKKRREMGDTLERAKAKRKRLTTYEKAMAKERRRRERCRIR